MSVRKLGRGEEKEVKKGSKRIVKRCAMTHLSSSCGIKKFLGCALIMGTTFPTCYTQVFGVPPPHRNTHIVGSLCILDIYVYK